MTSRTYYDTLQVSRFASASVIRAAYKVLSQKHHPDKHPHNLEVAHQNMKRLNEAYEVLSDPKRKASYDALIGALEHEKPGASTAPAPQGWPKATAPPPSEDGEKSAPDRDFHGKRRYDSDANAGQRGYYGGPDQKKPMPVASTVLLIFFVVSGVLAYIGRPKSTSEAAAVAVPVSASPAPSKFPRCVGSTIMASCERVEAELAAAAERANSVPVATSSQKGKPVAPTQPGNATFWAGDTPLASPKVVTPVVVRQRDHSCMSTVTLNLNSTNYSGIVEVQLRSGLRPGSKVLEQSEVYTSGVVAVTNVCPGTYFFAFATPDSPTVSTTRYFTVEQDSTSYSMPVITVTFSRSATPESQRVGAASRSQL